MSNLDIPILERPSFFDGQRLTADDLTAVQTFHRELRWLHNRSLHNWGIAFGYTVLGLRKQRVVQIQPGYALDCKGREIILNTTTTLPIPAVSGANGGGPATYYLTAAYAEDSDLTAETRQGVCDTAGAVRRTEMPLIRWQDPNEGFRHGLDVVLASIKVQNCQLAEDVSGVERRDAVPAQQPYLAVGQTTAGQTVWQFWPNEATPIGVMTTVSTASAGFRTSPRYQAHVVGRRQVPNSEILVDGYAQVAQPGALSFDLVMLLPEGRLNNFVLNPSAVFNSEFLPRYQSNDPDDLGWHVVWLGVEGS